MTIFPRFLYLILLAIAVVACKNTPNDGKDFNIEIFPKKKEYHLGDTLVVKITHPKFSEAISKTSFQFHQQHLEAQGDTIVLHALLPLGKQQLKVTAHTTNGQQYTVQKQLLLLAKDAPKIYTYKIINEYAHDKKAYTQGLEFIGDTLVESTGQYGESSIRKWNPFTGEVYKNVPLQPSYFGEGATVFKGRILQLTWREQIGMVYDKDLNFQK